MAAFLFVICGALRLARFNTQASEEKNDCFVGLPIPMGAAIFATIVLLTRGALEMDKAPSILINHDYPSPDHPDGCIGISIFLSIFNVHIQRVPLAGKVIRKWYNKGKFLAAWDHKASLDNEQSLIVLDTAIGPVGVKQIAGLIARRIATWPDEGQEVAAGERYGLIRFGSRVDLIVPKGIEIVCQIGDKVAGGITVMAKGK